MSYKFKAQFQHLQFSADFALSADQWSLVAHLIPLPQSVFLSLSCFRTSPLFHHILSHSSIFTFLSVCWLRSAWGQMLMVVISMRSTPETAAPPNICSLWEGGGPMIDELVKKARGQWCMKSHHLFIRKRAKWVGMRRLRLANKNPKSEAAGLRPWAFFLNKPLHQSPLQSH